MRMVRIIGLVKVGQDEGVIGIVILAMVAGGYRRGGWWSDHGLMVVLVFVK